jgi:Gluconate 2-dehydrogenase subunit 3
MTKHDEGRRAFLVGSAAGAAASVTLVPHAFAEDQARDATKIAAADIAASDVTAAAYRHGAFFNNDDAKTIAAFAERLMPGAPDKPGATDAGVLNYIDLALPPPTASRSANSPRNSRTSASARWRRTRRPNSSGRRRALSSRRCAPTPWKACFPIRSMAATRTSPAGGSSDSPARNRSTHRRIWAARRPSRANPPPACKRNSRTSGADPWLSRKQTL